MSVFSNNMFLTTSGVDKSLLGAIRTAGLTSGLKICLDAGDIRSWPGSGTKWLDMSGNGYDFFKGDDGTTNAPAFNGTPGALTNEYWGFNSGSYYFTYDTTNETWMQNLHKDNALFSWFAVSMLPGAGSGGGWFGDNANSGANVGTTTAGSNQIASINVGNGGGGAAFAQSAAGAISRSVYHGIGGSVNEAGGNVSFFYQDAGYIQISGSNTYDAAYASPSTGTATYTFQIVGTGNGNLAAGSGTQWAMFAMWESVALTKANFDSIYNTLKTNRPGYSLA